MVHRHWRGTAQASEANRYLEHLRAATLPQLAAIAGFIDASILRRPVPAGVEFLIVTRWESIEAIRRFAGSEAQRAVVPAEVQAMMVTYDQTAIHYELVD